MRSMFYDIRRTVMNAVRRAGYSITGVLPEKSTII